MSKHQLLSRKYCQNLTDLININLSYATVSQCILICNQNIWWNKYIGEWPSLQHAAFDVYVKYYNIFIYVVFTFVFYRLDG